MKSIYEHVLGADFHRLHPQIQRRFGFTSSDGIASIGSGVMDEIWKGKLYTEPFLRVGSWRRIMFPETGRNIPFTIENYAFVDQFGRETVSWIRTFESRRTRRFDAYMVYSDSRHRIVESGEYFTLFGVSGQPLVYPRGLFGAALAGYPARESFPVRGRVIG